MIYELTGNMLLGLNTEYLVSFRKCTIRMCYVGRPSTNKRRHWLVCDGFSLRMRRGYHVVQEVPRHWLRRGARGQQPSDHVMNVELMA